MSDTIKQDAARLILAVMAYRQVNSAMPEGSDSALDQDQ